MRRSKEEANRIHKQKCKELKRIRAQIAEELGIDLHQRECTYEGDCSGTCPKCRQEEVQLNAVILGLTTAAALTLSGCNIAKVEQLEGDVMYIPPEETQELNGAIAIPEEEDVIELEGDAAYIETQEQEYELAGEVPLMEEE